jgi:hypothetical protein
MTSDVRNWRRRCLGVGAALLLLAATAAAAEGRGKIGQYDPQAQTVEMFAGIKQGDIAVKLIPKDSTQCNLLIENKTDKPLNVKLPDVFAGVPVLAQAGAQPRARSGGTGGRSTTQSVSGGTGGGGMFNVPPEKVGQLKLPTVCLEHGKGEPRAAVPYQIEPLEKVTTKPGVRELCQMLGNGRIDQRAAQAAAWHLNGGMSWQELAAKRIRHANGTSEPYFTQAEMQAAMQVAATALKQADQQKPASGPSGSLN